MNNIVSSAAIAALILSTATSLCAQSTWYVRKHPTTTSPDGSQLKPYNTLKDVEAAAKAGDTIMVVATDETQGPLDGGITLKSGQKLLGMGAKVTAVPPPKIRAWITNTTTNYTGDAVVLANNSEVAGIHLSGTRRAAVSGTNVTGANVHELLVTDWNTGGGQAPRRLFGNLYPVAGVFFFMLGNDLTKKSNKCTGCLFDNGAGAAVGLDAHNQTRSELLLEGNSITSNRNSGLTVYAFGTSEAKLVIKDCFIDNIAGQWGVGAWGEDTPTVDLQVDGLTFLSTKNTKPRRGVEMSFNGGAKLSCRVVNSRISDTVDHGILALSWRNYTSAKATLDFHAENNTVTATGAGISCGAYDAGKLSTLRGTIKNNVIKAALNSAAVNGGGIECFCLVNGSTIDDATWTVTGNSVGGTSPYGVSYVDDGIARVSLTATNNHISGVATGIDVRRTSSSAGPVIFANNTTTGCSADGIRVQGASPKLLGNTASGNGAYGLRTEQAGVAFENGILWSNKLGSIDVVSGSAPTVTYSVVQGGNAGTGNIKVDPLFVDALNGDYHLRYDSPCRNKGNNSAVPSWLKTDFEGDDRIADKTVDMGADEFFPHLYYTGDLSPGGTAKVNAIGKPNSSVLWGISGFAGAYEPPVRIPGFSGVLYLRDPMLIVPMSNTSTRGLSQVSVKLSTNAPKGSVWTQALIGSTLSNLSIATVK